MPQYMIAFNDEWVPDFTPEEILEKSIAVRAVSAEMKTAGVLLFENGGIDASTVVSSVEARDGEPVFTDGPYVETKEHLGGFCVVDLPDDETARSWAGRIAVALGWPQEVHRFPPDSWQPAPPEPDRPRRPEGTDGTPGKGTA